MTNLAKFRRSLLAPVLSVALAGCAVQPPSPNVAPPSPPSAMTISPTKKDPGSMNIDKVTKSEDEWKQTLTPEEYRILRQKGTERAFTGQYWDHHDNGTYTCAACGAELFRSTEKFDSGCGWPSFFDSLDKSAVETHDDVTLGMHRIEVTCAKCGGHLGHVFPDGPKPTGQRYCINSVSIKFKKK